MRDTAYAKELARATVDLGGGSEGRIERLLFKDATGEGIRFSWWKGKYLVPRPLDLTEYQLLDLLKNALQEEVFSQDFLNKLKAMLK